VPRLLIATNNAGKVAEFRRLLDGLGWELVTPTDLGLDLEADEDGDTYETNARKKALAFTEASGLTTLADDSGIEVEGMGGEPGVRSARFLGADASYADRFTEINRRLADIPRDQRHARFVCVIAIVDPRTGEVNTVEGEVRGLITDNPRGERGFGYDPIFWLPERDATMAELPEDEKDIISHRGRATIQAQEILRELLNAQKET
jgi:XTP/dITP diphosphohydrolase